MTQETNFIRHLLNGLWLDIKVLCPGISWEHGLVTTHLLLNKYGLRAFTEELPKLDTVLLTYLSGEDHHLLDDEYLHELWYLFEPFLGITVPPTSQHACEGLRQLACIGKKLEISPRDGATDRMLKRFVDTDRSLPIHIEPTPVLSLARRLLSEVLPPIGDIDVYGRHGGGSVAEGSKCEPPVRWDTPIQMTEALFRLFPVGLDYCLPWYDRHAQVCPIDRYIPSVVTTVPKDGRGDRIICMEPMGLMFHELGLMDALYAHMNAHPLLKGRANVLDQNINKALALRGSIDRSVATIDLSEASDRVSLALVKAIFPLTWYELLKACRNPRYSLAGRTRYFRKFAPMGSALCFPVETLVFWSLASAIVARESGMSITKASQQVTVHGDDTIVPTQFATSVMDGFESVSLKVNQEKSYYTGSFRESCGGDYYLGHDVTPVRWKHPIRGGNTHVPSTFALANNLYRKGWWASARAVREWLLSTIRFEPSWFTGDSTPSGASFYSFWYAGGRVTKYNPTSQAAGVRTLREEAVRHRQQPTSRGLHRASRSKRISVDKSVVPNDSRLSIKMADGEVVQHSSSSLVYYTRNGKIRNGFLSVESCAAGSLAAHNYFQKRSKNVAPKGRTRRRKRA